MFDAKEGAWQPDRDTIAEVMRMPASGAGISYHPHAGQRGLVRRAGRAGLLPLEQGASPVLALPGDEVLWWRPLPAVCRFRQIPVGDRLLSFTAALSVTNAERFVSWLRAANQQTLTADVLAATLSTDERVPAALSGLAGNGETLASAVEEILDGLLPSAFGLLAGDVGDAHWESAVDTASLLAVGSSIGRGWRLRGQLGRGFFGEVWLADHPTMPGVAEALKFVPKPEYAQLARREALKLIDLCKDPTFDFRHVVRLTDVSTGVPFLVAYEYLDGQSLSAYVQRARGQRLTAAQTVDIAGQILEGLDQIHQAGYVHYDLHPGNVMLLTGAAGAQVKIVDFGLAWRLAVAGRGQEYATALEGARPFAKSEPRDLTKGEFPDARTDLFSVGLLIWLMLTGRWGLPEQGTLEDAWPRNRALLAIIHQACLAPRADRYTDAAEMLRDLRRTTAWRPSTRAAPAGIVVEPERGALELAVQAAPAGSTLQLRAGRYTLDRTLVLDKAITLTGAGLDHTWILYAGEGPAVSCIGEGKTTLLDLAFEALGSRAGHVVEVTSSAFEIGRCRFAGATYGRASQRGGAGLCLAAKATGTVTASEAVRNAMYGVLVDESACPALHNNVCRDNFGSGITYLGESGGTAQDNLCAHNAVHGIDVRGQATPRLQANRCERNTGAGIMVDQHSAVTGEMNECLDNAQDGVHVTGATDARLQQNRCERNRWSGIAFTDHASGAAEANTCGDNDQHGIYAGGESSPSITANACELNARSGIACGGFARPSAVANVCRHNDAHGIVVADQSAPLLQDNRCEENEGDGIAYRDQAGGNAAGNLATGNAVHDLTIAATARPSLAGLPVDIDQQRRMVDLRRQSPVPPPASAGGPAVLDWLFDSGRISLERHPFLSTQPGKLAGHFSWDRVEGMLLGLAIGDSLGNQTEFWSPDQRQARYGEVSDYIRLNAATGRPAGYPSGDTELSFLTVQHLLAERRLVPELLAKKLSARPVLGAGLAHAEFARNLTAGKPWYEAGPYRGGNGAMMRMAPVLLPHLRNPSPALWADVALAGMLTHNDRGSLAACIAFVRLLWLALQMTTAPDPFWWVDTFCWTATALEGDTLYPSRTSPFDRRRNARLSYRGAMGGYAEACIARAFDGNWSVTEACHEWAGGSYLLETIPCLLYLLCRHADDPEYAMLRAVNDTVDNNTIAALTGAVLGALHGKEALPKRWRDGLLGRVAPDAPDGELNELIDQARGAFAPE